MNGNHVDNDNDYSPCLFALTTYFSHTHTHTFIQNQKGSVRVHDEANESMEKQNCKKRKGKEKKTRELASILETNQSFFC